MGLDKAKVGTSCSWGNYDGWYDCPLGAFCDWGAVTSLIIFSVLGAVLYRMGGTHLGTKFRDWGVPTVMLWWFILNGIEHWSLVICWFLMWGAQTTYNKWAQNLFGRK